MLLAACGLNVLQQEIK